MCVTVCVVPHTLTVHEVSQAPSGQVATRAAPIRVVQLKALENLYSVDMSSPPNTRGVKPFTAVW